MKKAWAIYNPEIGFSKYLAGSRRVARGLSYPEDKEKVLEVALLPEKSDSDFLPVVGWAVTDKEDANINSTIMLPGRHEARVLAKETGSTVYKVVLA